MYPYLLELGPITIGSLGAMIALGFLTAHYILQRELKRLGLNPDLGSTIVTTGMICGIVGSKLYFVLFEMPGVDLGGRLDALFSGYGLTWYGGLLLGTVVMAWIIRRKGVPVLKVLDPTAMGAAVGYAIGRIGCQLAGDGDYGVPTDLPWGMAYPNGVVPILEQVHPTPVYETLSHLAIFALMWSVRRRWTQPGTLLGLYLLLGGLARFWVEFIRLNSPVLWGLSDSQLISLGFIVIGGVLLWRLRPYTTAQPENAQQ